MNQYNEQMANIKTTQVAIKDSIEYFISHWKYWHNYEDSTVLVDPAYNIIAWFDRKKENIDVVMAEIPTPWGFVIANGKGIILNDEDGLIKYDSYDYNMLRSKYKEVSRTIIEDWWDIDWLWEKMLSDMKKHNVDYFSNLIKKLKNENNIRTK